MCAVKGAVWASSMGTQFEGRRQKAAAEVPSNAFCFCLLLSPFQRWVPEGSNYDQWLKAQLLYTEYGARKR